MKPFVPAPGPDGVRRYGTFQTYENPKHCCVERRAGGAYRGFKGSEAIYGQCRRKRGHGPDGAYCHQHALMLEREEAGAA